MTAIEAGYWAALPTVVGVIGSLLIPRLATPERRFAILAALCGAALVASLLLQAHGEFSLTTGLILQGIARSSMMTVLILTLVELPGIGEQRAGVASGMFFSAASAATGSISSDPGTSETSCCPASRDSQTIGFPSAVIWV